MPSAVNSPAHFLAGALLLLGLSATPASAQRIWLDAGMAPAPKAKAVLYLEPGGADGTGGYSAQVHNLDGTVRAMGRYADAKYLVPDGHFKFFHPNGKLESEGEFAMGRKDGIWTRKDEWGGALAEKVYDAKALNNIVYTLAATMPQYPGGEKAMVRYVREKAGRANGNVMASFIVEKDGQVTDVQVTGADPQTAGEIATAISGAPRWEAGVQDGQPVRVQMRVPIK